MVLDSGAFCLYSRFFRLTECPRPPSINLQTELPLSPRRIILRGVTPYFSSPLSPPSTLFGARPISPSLSELNRFLRFCWPPPGTSPRDLFFIPCCVGKLGFGPHLPSGAPLSSPDSCFFLWATEESAYPN